MKTVGRLVFAGMFLAVFAASASAQLRFGGGAQSGVAFSSFKTDLYGTGLIFGGHGDLDMGKYITLRLAFDYATFGADDAKLKTLVGNQTVQSIEAFLGGPLDASGIATVQSSISAVSGGRASAPVVTVSALGKLPTGSMVTPYAIVGLGMTFLSFSDLSITSTGLSSNGQTLVAAGTSTSKIDSQTKFGMQFGAGAELKVSKLVALYLEVRYNLIFTEGGSSSYIPVMVGVTFGG